MKQNSYFVRFVMILALLLTVNVSVMGDELRKGGSIVGKIESNGDVRINGSIVGRFEANGDIRVGGSIGKGNEAEHACRHLPQDSDAR